MLPPACGPRRVFFFPFGAPDSGSLPGSLTITASPIADASALSLAPSPPLPLLSSSPLPPPPLPPPPSAAPWPRDEPPARLPASLVPGAAFQAKMPSPLWRISSEPGGGV